MNRLGVSIVLIFGAAFALYLPTWLDDEAPTRVINMDDALIPNYQVINLSSKLYDKDGNLTHQVFAKKMEHYDQLGFVTFVDPVYSIYVSNSNTPWQVTANEGTLYDDNRIQLENDVRINNLAANDFVRQIDTQFIEINLDSSTLISDQPVQISGADYFINSIGFKANLETQIYELSNHVQTQYTPSR